MKHLYKHEHGTLPVYLNSMFKKPETKHGHNTRGSTSIYVPPPKHKLLETGIRSAIPLIRNKLPDIVTSKLYTHSLNGFATYLKTYLITQYTDTCTVTNCYVCNKGNCL